MKNFFNTQASIFSLEKWTLLFFMVVGYFIIYKYSFYSTLGVNWYITNISTSQVILGSLNFLILTVIAFFLATIFFLFFKIKIFEKIYKIFILLTAIALLLMMFYINVWDISNYFDSETFYNIYIFKYYKMFFVFFVLSFLILVFYEIHNQNLKDLDGFYKEMNKNVDKYESLDGKGFIVTSEYLKSISGIKNVVDVIEVEKYSFYIMIIIIFFVSSIVASYEVGKSEARLISTKKDKYLNYAVIKGSNEKWYVVDYLGDKFLLIKDGVDTKNNFKIVEYKEVNYIESEKYYDPIEEKINQFLTK